MRHSITAAELQQTGGAERLQELLEDFLNNAKEDEGPWTMHTCMRHAWTHAGKGEVSWAAGKVAEEELELEEQDLELRLAVGGQRFRRTDAKWVNLRSITASD